MNRKMPICVIPKSRDRPKSALRSSSLKMQRTLFLNFYHSPRPKNIPKDTHKTQNSNLETQKKTFFEKKILFLRKELSAQNTTFSQAEISKESRRVPIDQIKVSDEKHRAKKVQQSMIKYLE